MLSANVQKKVTRHAVVKIQNKNSFLAKDSPGLFHISLFGPLQVVTHSTSILSTRIMEAMNIYDSYVHMELSQGTILALGKGFIKPFFSGNTEIFITYITNLGLATGQFMEVYILHFVFVFNDRYFSNALRKIAHALLSDVFTCKK